MNTFGKILQFEVFPKKSTPLPKSKVKKFSLLGESDRVIRTYGGFIPSAPKTVEHILRCEHLRQLPGDKFAPYHAEENYTHQIWLWYKLKKNPEKLELLFREQFDFKLPGMDADFVAKEVTDFLAYLLLNGEEHPLELLRHQYSHLFWTKAVEKKLFYLSKKALAS
jgi:hypothetical protein